MLEAGLLVRTAFFMAAVFCVIILGLSAFITTQYGPNTSAAAIFLLLNSVWSLLALVYLSIVPIYGPRLFNEFVCLGLNAVTTIFWFAGAIGIAGTVGAQWRAEQASTAFSFFLWAIFTGLLVVKVKSVVRSRRQPQSPLKP
ncbi:unnamed protein product [Clonostachys solani]|uniref:MARVEL domain-containing protein n=1 Tax=Clonostachys solani TaxID=160281 RepID=A0A9P0ERI4_9HYPO|nr:unnamed protein product [Clonostachys solani]